MKQPRKFCYSQHICKEDVGEGTYSCLCNLAEGHVFPCGYCEADIKIYDWSVDGDKKKHYGFQIQSNPKPRADGVCRDFRITPRVKKDLIAQIVSELEKS